MGEVQYKFFSSAHALRIFLEPHYKFIAQREFYDQSAMANIFKVRRSCVVYYTCDDDNANTITLFQKKIQL